MPIIDFHGKKAIQNYEPPYHILEEVTELNYQSPVEGNSQDNILIEGDNLLALKSLLPEYEGKIKCIYIDPPYNTNNKDWVYCDNIEITSKNDPAWKQVEKFLKDGNEVDYNDLSRHSKWLCMMYPRLKLLHKLLKDDGVIFVSIDDNEVHHLRMIMDEIFGEANFVAQIIFQSNSIKNNAKQVSVVHEYCLIYAKNLKIQSDWRVILPNSLELYNFFNSLDSKLNFEEKSKIVRNYIKEMGVSGSLANYYQVDSNGLFRLDNIGGVKHGNTKTVIYHPITKKPCKITNGGWRYKEEKIIDMLSNGLIYFGKDEKSVPQVKRYLLLVHEAVFNSVIYQDTSQDAKKIDQLFNNTSIFDFPKNLNFVQSLIKLVTDQNSIILDSFAGSGTTAHAVIDLNKQDGGNRKFITIQLPESIKEDKPAYLAGYKFVHEITRERVKRVAGGYTNSKGEQVEGLGGGFKYYRIGTPLFTKKGGDIVSTVTWEQLAPYIYFTEFKTPLVDKSSIVKPKVGIKEKTELYLLYKEPNTNTLTEDLIVELNKKSKAKKVIYADKLEFGLDEDFLKDNGIIFKQIPYDILSI